MQWLIDRFQANPATQAFVHDNRVVTYGEVARIIAENHALLEKTGIQQGETVVVLGDYSPEVFCLMMALARNQNIVVPLTRGAVIEETAALSISGCHWYITFAQNGMAFSIERRVVTVDNVLLANFLTEKAPGLILFSSGSTGRPKGILHNFNRVVEKFRKVRSPVVAIPFLMIDHFGGINTLLAITSSLGTVITVAERSVSNICQAIAQHRVELLPATPSFLTLLLASKAYSNFDLSSLKRITYGTEVMPQSTLDRIKALFPNVDLLQTYGLSEVGVLRSQSRSDGSLWVRIGGEGFQTKIINGILWIKSDYAMVGYLNAPSEFDEDGWFNTQDQVETDGEYFRILGRSTDLINVGGQKVYPAEVESVILELDNVLDVAVFGEPHTLLGQIVVARILLEHPETPESLKKRVRQACSQHLSSFKVPAKVVITTETLHSARQKKMRKPLSQ